MDNNGNQQNIGDVNKMEEQIEKEEVGKEEADPGDGKTDEETEITDKHECGSKCPSTCDCVCRGKVSEETSEKKVIDEEFLQNALSEKEQQLRKEFKEFLTQQTSLLKERFNFILHNEQVRTACKLRETHRERKEKIQMLRQQLECKNIAALMYVMCAERNRSKYEKLQLIETYTGYINMLNELLNESQELILYLSKGYKTAARVDYEWQNKTRKLVKEFLAFICNFTNTPDEQGQYFLDMIDLLNIQASTQDDPNEDPIEEEEEPEIELEGNKTWWERLEDHDRPFVVYGDMADFTPQVRRATLKKVKAKKTAPRQWKEYNFNRAFMMSGCPNAEKAKEDFIQSLCTTVTNPHFECSYFAKAAAEVNRNRRNTSVDLRSGAMGSILKIITQATIEPKTKANLLGARDSMEIGSTTKLREKYKSEDTVGGKSDKKEDSALDISNNKKETTLYEQLVSKLSNINETGIVKLDMSPTEMTSIREPLSDEVCKHKRPSIMKNHNDVQHDNSMQTIKGEHGSQGSKQRSANASPIKVIKLGKENMHTIKGEHGSQGSKHRSANASPTKVLKLGKEIEHTDSLQVIPTRVPDKDAKINIEKICPTSLCKHMKVDSLMESLPPYMKENVYHYFEQTYDNYETCTKEQLELLSKRFEEKRKKDLEMQKEKDKMKKRESVNKDPLLDWQSSVEGVACQTSEQFEDEEQMPCTCNVETPPCTCGVSTSDLVLPGAEGTVFNLADMIPVKLRLDNIKEECMFDANIDYDRFRVVGQDVSESNMRSRRQEDDKFDFTSKKVREIIDILKQHPSLAEIFQANARSC